MAAATNFWLVLIERSLRVVSIPHIVFAFLSRNGWVMRVLCRLETREIFYAHFFHHFQKGYVIFELMSFLNGSSYKNEIGRKWKLFQRGFQSSHNYPSYLAILVNKWMLTYLAALFSTKIVQFVTERFLPFHFKSKKNKVGGTWRS